MTPCPACHEGALEEQLAETWMRREQRWVFFTSVPAMVCNVCGEKVFPQQTAERLAQLLDPSRREVPTGSLWCPVYDLAIVETARAHGERPTVFQGIEPSLTVYTPPIPRFSEADTFQRLVNVQP